MILHAVYMILHAVYCNVLNEIERNEVTALFQQLEALCERLDGALSFAGGPNRDFERKSKIYLDGSLSVSKVRMP